MITLLNVEIRQSDDGMVLMTCQKFQALGSTYELKQPVTVQGGKAIPITEAVQWMCEGVQRQHTHEAKARWVPGPRPGVCSE